MFDRFTLGARGVIVGAGEGARRIGHNWVGCEHILLAIAGSDTPVGEILNEAGVTPEAVEAAIAAVVGTTGGDGDEKAALATLGIDLDEVRQAAEKIFGEGALDAARTSRRRPRHLRRRRRCTRRDDGLPLSPRAKRCLDMSLREALRLRHDYVGVEHIALSLLARDDTVAWKVLRRLGVVPANLSRRVHESLRRTA